MTMTALVATPCTAYSVTLVTDRCKILKNMLMENGFLATQKTTSVGNCTLHHAPCHNRDISQLSLLPLVGREMSTSQSAVMLCSWAVKARMAHLWISVWVAGKTVWSLVNTCHTWAF